MRQRTLLHPTLREAPADAEAKSHILLLRGGYIRQLAAGVYTYLPLGWRVLTRLTAIVREEMDLAGGQELLLPALLPADLWHQSGRYEHYGPELMRLDDRHGRPFVLGPTHEEAITALARDEWVSYRQLPALLYQIQTKFRDERRPRFGLLRGREFLMKDAYSFALDHEGLDQAYRSMYAAYEAIFKRSGLHYRAVEADAGTIGGDGQTHEFMALADIGEDTVVYCSCCGYAANLEKAEAGGESASQVESGGSSTVRASADTASEVVNNTQPQLIHTPGAGSMEQISRFMQADMRQFAKTLIFLANGRPVAVLVRGDREVNETKVRAYLGVDSLELADGETVKKACGAPVGFAGPVGLELQVLADREVAVMSCCITGANREDYHVTGVRPGVDFSLQHTGDFRNAEEGEGCPRCLEGRLQFRRGIEVGHIFKLGTKYSRALGAKIKNRSGQEEELIMGCYGIGVSRLMAALAEQHHDETGLLWPEAIAPFQVHVIPVSIQNSHQAGLAEELYRQLSALGLDVLLDDREERPGVKFKDADLIGAPWRIVAGKLAEEGQVELLERQSGQTRTIPAAEAVEFLSGCLRVRKG